MLRYKETEHLIPMPIPNDRVYSHANPKSKQKPKEKPNEKTKPNPMSNQNLM